MNFLDILFGKKKEKAQGIRHCTDCYFYDNGWCKRDNVKLFANMAQICNYWVVEGIGEKGFRATTAIKGEGYQFQYGVEHGEDDTEVSTTSTSYVLKKTVVCEDFEAKTLDTLKSNLWNTVGGVKSYAKVTVEKDLGQGWTGQEDTVDEWNVLSSIPVERFHKIQGVEAPKIRAKIYLKQDSGGECKNIKFEMFGIIKSGVVYY